MAGRFVLANQRLCDLLGYPREELLNRRMQDVTHPEDLAQSIELMEKSKREGNGSYDVEKRYVRKDGAHVWVHVSSTVLRDGGGRPQALLGVITDVTARRRAEEELYRTKALAESGLARWQAVVESMTEGLVLASPRGELTAMNPAALALHEFASMGEMLTRLADYPDLFELHDASGKFLPLSEWPMSRVLRGERLNNYEVRVRRRDTGKVWVGSYGGTQVRDPEGTVALAVLAVRDVTVQKTAEANLQESEARFRQLAETIPQLAWMANPDGFITWYNRRWYDYTGTTPQQMEGWGWQAVHDPDELPRVLEAWRHSIATGVTFEMEFPLRGADGLFRWFLTRVAPLRDAGGRITLWFGTNTDIEDWRRAGQERAKLLDAERTARAEAERASRVKDEFLATLSHELRTPLNAILGWSQILRSDGSSDEDMRQGLETIERNARAQTKIIEDLLEMSRIISGKVRLEVQRVDLAPVIEAAVQTVRHAADSKGVRLQVVLDPHAGPISGDPSRLQQVFWNLLSNSVKFSPRGSRVQVLLERVNSHVEVSIIDSGEGMKPEFLPYVFDRFRQADATTTRRHGGLGLGLSIVKQLVELHGGSVRAKSPGPGKGSTFTVTLPLTPLHAEPEPLPERRHPSGHVGLRVAPLDDCAKLDGLRVLVVDDEPDARSLVKRLLEDCNAVVAVAASATEAFELVRADRPDVMISDIGMPAEDGYSLIRRVRALAPEEGGDVPAVALTAYARSEDRRRAVMAGFQHHVAKPVEPAELIAIVASVVAWAAKKQR